MPHRCPYTLRSGVCQTGVRNPDSVDEFKRLMVAKKWDYEGRGKTFVYWRDGQTIYIAEGHHRANAALEIGRQSGNWSHLEKLLQYGKLEPGIPPPSNIGRFHTRSFWSRLLERLGW